MFAQGALTIAWWPWISISAEAQSRFFAADTADIVLSKFAAPDIIVFAGGSIFASFLALASSKYSPHAAWLVTGAAAYACIGAIAVNWPLFSVPLADALMLGTLASSTYCAVRLGRVHSG